jgi:hypothetical protein
MFTSIRARNARHWASLAQIRRPVLTGSLQQAAFLCISAAEVVTIKVWALSARWSSHELIINLQMYKQRVLKMNLTIFFYCVAAIE